MPILNPPPQQNSVIEKDGRPSQPWVRWFTIFGRVIATDGTYRPPTFADADAPDNAIYYSSTTSKLTYSDPSGVKHVLY